MTNSQKRLLVFAAVLAAIQFVVKPLLAWQNEVATEIALQQGRLERSEQLLANAETLTAAAEQAKAVQQTMLAAFPDAQEATLAQIQQQGELEALFREQGLRVEQFSWLTGVLPRSTELAQLRGSITVTGSLTAIANAHYALLKAKPTVVPESIEVRSNSRRGSRGGYRMTMMLNVRLQQVEAEAQQ